MTGDLPNVASIYNKGQKEDLRNYWPISLTLRKVKEYCILSVITQHMQNTQEIRPSQHGLIKGESYLTYVIFFYDQMTHLVDKGKAVNVIYLQRLHQRL